MHSMAQIMMHIVVNTHVHMHIHPPTPVLSD